MSLKPASWIYAFISSTEWSLTGEYDPFSCCLFSYFFSYTSPSLLFYSELAAIKKVLGNVYQEQRSIEIGVGTGRFAQALHITYGADPSRRMLELARERNIICIQAVVEDLPLKDKSLDLALMVTIDPFMTDMQQAFAEVRRILKTDGIMVLGMIDRNSRLGDVYEKKYEKRQHEKG